MVKFVLTVDAAKNFPLKMAPLPNVMVRQKMDPAVQSGVFVDQMQITVHVINVLITELRIKEVNC